jgi:sugar lactone lactonase YvrE
VYSSDDGVTPIGIRGEAAGYIEVDQAGTLWVGGEWRGLGSCGGVRSFDGSGWHRYLEDVCVIDLDIAPDGSVWVTGAKGPPRPGPQPGTGDTYRIDPALAEAGDVSP